MEECKTDIKEINLKYETYIACPLCKNLYKIETGYEAEGIIDNNLGKIKMYICPKCYKTIISMNLVQRSVGGSNDR